MCIDEKQLKQKLERDTRCKELRSSLVARFTDSAEAFIQQLSEVEWPGSPRVSALGALLTPLSDAQANLQ